MARWLRARLTFANVVALLALFVALGGPAWALQGMNTVFSDDIVNGEVKTLDILNGTVGNADLADGSVDSGEVVDGSLTGADVGDGSLEGADLGDGSVGNADLGDGSVDGGEVVDGSLTGTDVEDGTIAGADVDESSLGTVPSATQASFAESIADDSVSASALGTITRRIGSVVVPGNTPENGNYLTDDVTVTCVPGEIAIGWEAYWTVGEDPNDELFLSEVILVQNPSNVPYGAHVTGGNDTAQATTLLVAVYCLTP